LLLYVFYINSAFKLGHHHGHDCRNSGHKRANLKLLYGAVTDLRYFLG